MPDQEVVDRFLPVFKPILRLDPDQPVSMGAFGSPDVFIEVKKQIEEALIGSQKVAAEVWKDFEKLFGRTYKPVESYKTKGAEILLVTMGSISETAMTAVDVSASGAHFRLRSFFKPSGKPRPWPWSIVPFLRAV
jgi:pyruvate ferredoxin oxidoreductase alpha subunit